MDGVGDVGNGRGGYSNTTKLIFRVGAVKSPRRKANKLTDRRDDRRNQNR